MSKFIYSQMVRFLFFMIENSMECSYINTLHKRIKSGMIFYSFKFFFFCLVAVVVVAGWLILLGIFSVPTKTRAFNIFINWWKWNVPFYHGINSSIRNIVMSKSFWYIIIARLIFLCLCLFLSYSLSLLLYLFICILYTIYIILY